MTPAGNLPRVWIVSGLTILGAFQSERLQAQTAGESGRFEVSAGATWIGSSALGSRDATLTTAAGDRFRLFSTSSDLGAAVGLVGRAGRRVAGLVEVEVAAAYVTPTLSTSVANDAENASPATASDAIRQFTIEGGVLVEVSRRTGRRIRPFVAGGGGYLRQLHEGNTLVQTGRVIYAGGGVRIPLTASGAATSHELGIRVDVRALVRSKGVALDAGTLVTPAASASFFARF